MQQIPLRKRILYYLALFPISLAVSYFSTILMIIISGNRITGMSFFFIPAFIITHYVFGLFFLKTKRIFKFIIPFIISLASYCAIMLIWYIDFDFRTHLFDMYGFVDLIIPMSFVYAILWEIAYQILIKCLNKKSSSEIME